LLVIFDLQTPPTFPTRTCIGEIDIEPPRIQIYIIGFRYIVKAIIIEDGGMFIRTLDTGVRIYKYTNRKLLI